MVAVYYNNHIAVPLYEGLSSSLAYEDLYWPVGSSLYLDFEKSIYMRKGAVISQSSSISCTRSTTGYALTAAGVLQNFAINTARRTDRGLLVEQSSTNLQLYSQDLDNAAHTKVRCSITANATTAPDGTLTADKAVEDTTASNSHVYGNNISITSGTTYTRAMFIKAAERSQAAIVFPGSAFTSTQVVFDASNGTSTVTAGSVIARDIIPLANGWYYCYATITATATASAFIETRLCVANNATYTGDGVSGLFIWGMQTEASVVPTSYIPTTSATVTRGADTISVNNFSDWYNAPEGSVFIEAETNINTSRDNVYFGFSDNTFNESIYGKIGTGGNMNSPIVIDGGVSQTASLGLVAMGSYSSFAMASRYKLNDVHNAVNGSMVSSGDTSATIPTVDRLHIGNASWSGANGWVNTYIKKFAYIPRALSNTELQQLTLSGLIALFNIIMLNSYDFLTDVAGGLITL